MEGRIMANSGIVKLVIGEVKDGTGRILQVGDNVLLNEQIITGSSGAIAIEFGDMTIDLGRDSNVLLNEAMLTPEGEIPAAKQTVENVQDEVEAIQQALADGENFDPSNLEAPAAGGTPVTAGSVEDAGSTLVEVDYLNPERTPDNGFETKGISIGFLEPEGEFILNPQQSGVAAIEDNDKVSYSITESSSIKEGDVITTVIYTVTQTGTLAAGESATVDYATKDGTATDGTAAHAGSDYQAASGKLIFTGTTDGAKLTFAVSILNDAIIEKNEDYTVSLSNPSSNATITVPTVITTILDDDAPTADAPTLSISVEEIINSNSNNLITNGSFEDISTLDSQGNIIRADYNISPGGLVSRVEIPGWKLVDPSTMPKMEPHHKNHAGVGVTDGDNYMDLGASPGNSSIMQQVSGLVASNEYKLSFDFKDKAAIQESGQAGKDSGVMQVIWNGDFVVEVQGNNIIDWESSTVVVVAGSGDGSNTLIFNEIGVNDDNWGMAIDNVQLLAVESYQYQLTINAALTDIDGSEELGDVIIDGKSIPVGSVLSIGGVSLSPDSNGDYVVDVTSNATDIAGSESVLLTLAQGAQFSPDQINLITGSVTATEKAGGNSAITTETALFEITGNTADDYLTGTVADELIKGMNGNDTLIGGAGDDVIFGNSGADEFIWTKGDVAPGAVDTVADFKASEGDVLNLADLLSDHSHTIAGIDNGGNLQLQISTGSTPSELIQTIDLIGVAAGVDANATLNQLLIDGSINDGI